MKILVSGASGLVGRALCLTLESEGHTVLRLVRKTGPLLPGAIYWNPAKAELASDDLEGFDAVVHLAGEPIANGRWTAARKARILESRVEGTQLLCERLAACASPPKTLISASAIGFYGNRGDDLLTEDSEPGSGFLSEVCRAWEESTASASSVGIRVVNLRIGLVLSPNGGALGKMLPAFRFGMGGTLGGGKPWMSWIHLDDLVGAITHTLNAVDLTGPLNGVSSAPVTNRVFTKTLGKVLGRPTFLPVPTWPLRLVLGEMANELLLTSARVTPKELQNSGYEFLYPDLDSALRDLLA